MLIANEDHIECHTASYVQLACRMRWCIEIAAVTLCSALAQYWSVPQVLHSNVVYVYT
jgi:hypothetical protein